MFCSLWFRQTNAVWTVFIGLCISLDSIQDSQALPRQKVLLESQYFGIFHALGIVMEYIRYLLNYSALLVPRVVSHVIVVLSFVYFVFQNGSIVLGDKQNHTASFHLPQFFYFFAFSFGFGFFALEPWQLVAKWLAAIKRNQMSSILLLFVLTYGILNYTHVHPFLLADNRHYTFYVWRYFLSKFWIRLLLIPVYFIAITMIFVRLAETKSFLWLLMFSGSTALCLIPSPLIEFRYYVIPFMIMRLQLKPSTSSIRMEIIFFSIVNAITIYLFLYRPFEWKHESGTQRFMW
jgi:alpha-1,2-glucosyltransferase